MSSKTGKVGWMDEIVDESFIVCELRERLAEIEQEAEHKKKEVEELRDLLEKGSVDLVCDHW